MKRNVGRGLWAVVALFLTLNGLMFFLAPDRAAEKLLFAPDGAEALSNIRGFLGAAVLAIGLNLFVAVKTARIDNARPAALFTLLLVVARVVSHFMDGANPQMALYTAVPATAFALLVVGHKLVESES